MVWLYYRVVMGQPSARLAGLALELEAREVVTLLPLALLAVGLGLHPEWVLSYLHAPVTELLSTGMVP
jgi:NADH-quinone oxidoreductase subunit M